MAGDGQESDAPGKNQKPLNLLQTDPSMSLEKIRDQ